MVLRTLVLIVLILLLGYGFIKAWPLLSGPSLSISVPTNYTTSADGFITISGTANHTESVTLNGGPLLIDQQGHFEETLLLPQGGGILTVTATDRFGRSTTQRRTVFVP
jgi:hypothetical protein